MLLENKCGLIIGLSSDISIGWGITKVCAEEGAKLLATYNREAKKKRAEPLAQQVNAELYKCNAQSDEEIEALFKTIGEKGIKLDFIVHSIAFANMNDLRGDFDCTSRQGFAEAMDISAYSLIKFVHEALSHLNDGASILSLSYYGAEKVVPNYKVMGVCKAALEAIIRELAAELGPRGIRVNGISAGAIRTLASSGISDFKELFKGSIERSPLKKACTIEEVGRSAAYLLSDYSSAVTGEIHHVDCGFNITAA